MSRASSSINAVVGRGREIGIHGNGASPACMLSRRHCSCIVVDASLEPVLPILKPPPSLLAVPISSLLVIAVPICMFSPRSSCSTRIQFGVHHVETAGLMSTRPLHILHNSGLYVAIAGAFMAVSLLQATYAQPQTFDKCSATNMDNGDMDLDMDIDLGPVDIPDVSEMTVRSSSLQSLPSSKSSLGYRLFPHNFSLDLRPNDLMRSWTLTPLHTKSTSRALTI